MKFSDTSHMSTPVAQAAPPTQPSQSGTHKLQIAPLQKKDYRLAIRYAEEGMHFSWYARGAALKLYSWYFFRKELNAATRAWACYYRGFFQGALLAHIEGEQPLFKNPFISALVRVSDFLVGSFAKGGAGAYEQANDRMLAAYKRRIAPAHPQGELLFLAANPQARVKGVGSRLLSTFARAAEGKLIYLYTDGGCTYQFYERRGFTKEEEEKIPVKRGKTTFTLDCYLYAKQF